MRRRAFATTCVWLMCVGIARMLCAAPAVPVYAGPWDERPALLGDWAGTRTPMLENGMLWAVDETTFYEGVASGGREQQFTFAGHGDILLNWDMSKVGFQEGFFVKVRAEHRYGESIGPSTGSFLPATILTQLPIANSEQVYLTDVLFTQALSENFAVYAGKMDTFDGDSNTFAHGRGKDQFSNFGFVVNPLLIRAVPYSTLGTGFVILKDKQPLFVFNVLNAVDTTNSVGINQLFNEGCVLAAELHLNHEIAGYVGHQVMGGAWNSREFATLGQDPRIILPDVPINRQDSTWALYYNFDQYLVHYTGTPGTGWGVFGRASIGDDQTNPFAWFLSTGIGGNSPIAGREAKDTFGVGYYYLATSDEIGPFLTAALGPIGDGHGVEMFYNYAATPWFHLTPNLQILEPEPETVDTAVVVGLRGKIVF
ncbi:MAG: carbohydrate porin [Pirellulales bacterium]